MINLSGKRNAYAEAMLGLVRRDAFDNLCLRGFVSGLPSSFDLQS